MVFIYIDKTAGNLNAGAYQFPCGSGRHAARSPDIDVRFGMILYPLFEFLQRLFLSVKKAIQIMYSL